MLTHSSPFIPCIPAMFHHFLQTKAECFVFFPPQLSIFNNKENLIVFLRDHPYKYEGWNFNFGNAAVTLIQHTYTVHIFTDPRCTPQSYVEHVPSDEGVA